MGGGGHKWEKGRKREGRMGEGALASSKRDISAAVRLCTVAHWYAAKAGMQVCNML